MPSPDAIRTDQWPTPLLAAVTAAGMPGLTDRPHDPDLVAWIDANPDLGLGRPDRRGDFLACCRSGLYLLAGDLDRSHSISQAVESAEGSFWHGIMHRREPDYGNAKYWVRRVGQHPAYAAMHTAAENVPVGPQNVTGADGWDAAALVDLYQAGKERGGEAEQQAIELGWIEWQVLFDYCLQHA